MAQQRNKLDDPERVQHITNRGEDLFRHLYHTPQQQREPLAYKPDPDSNEKIIHAIEDELDHSRIESAMDRAKTYIPRDKLRNILTFERVQIIANLPCLQDFKNKDELTERIYYGSNGSGPLLKLLAVFIGMEKFDDFPNCIKEGIDDGCLPMKVDNASGDAGDIFPMTSGDKLQKQGGTGKGSKAQTHEASFAYGGFSEVYRVEIDNSHHEFGSIGIIRRQKNFFALKKLTSHDRHNFDMELSSLLFCMDKSIKEEVYKHMTQPLATFEVDEPMVKGKTYYILFEWAEGNLNDFWKRNDEPRPAMGHCKWMSHEFHSLCRALACVHNGQEEYLQTLDGEGLEKKLQVTSGDASRLYGRHGDIKPDNFLWLGLSSESIGHLAISDFGLGRLHTQVSRSNQDPRNIARTETYKAPEFELPGGKISRASDIFSLGCVFLEYVTWFLLGSQKVTEEFSSIRSETDINGFESDAFFIIRSIEGENDPRPFLKESVKQWIEMLQDHEGCTWYLHQLLDIIRDKMLAPDRENRIKIIPLIKEMDTLRQACERNDSFYLKAKNKP
ncbi:hypothetical protein Daesc_008117 [Daldinia eschscholtzii]|uniref:Protein kinase domain-containing protein n=1 Tax=Daldinia eschscholtzii TaxID=292717 RepID=A0AAX6MBK2_9PEZI